MIRPNAVRLDQSESDLTHDNRGRSCYKAPSMLSEPYHHVMDLGPRYLTPRNPAPLIVDLELFAAASSLAEKRTLHPCHATFSYDISFMTGQSRHHSSITS